MRRLPVLDILHRTVVYSLAGFTAWTVVSAVMVHRETLQKGRGISYWRVWKLKSTKNNKYMFEHLKMGNLIRIGL
ncbi:hypothetical protein EV361DRAFT_559201 [Lentinula raphanica]|nr:hypothetical protein EV361DRAFT_559201 [Lentinula raphanica]